jgi:hypothetical protein
VGGDDAAHDAGAGECGVLWGRGVGTFGGNDVCGLCLYPYTHTAWGLHCSRFHMSGLGRMGGGGGRGRGCIGACITTAASWCMLAQHVSSQWVNTDADRVCPHIWKPLPYMQPDTPGTEQHTRLIEIPDTHAPPLPSPPCLLPAAAAGRPAEPPDTALAPGGPPAGRLFHGSPLPPAAHHGRTGGAKGCAQPAAEPGGGKLRGGGGRKQCVLPDASDLVEGC